MNLAARAIAWTETGRLPDVAVRSGIRHLLRRRLDEIRADDPAAAADAQEAFVATMHAAPVALLPDQANAQHYEVPADFIALALGPHRKYSCCFWGEGVTTLAEAEAAALRLSCERAGIADGMRVLELGCGWGSLTLWIAAQFPGASVTAVSNSRSQRAHIEAEARRRGLGNVTVLTRDMNDFDIAQRFDRVVSIEMFEHMRNWREMFTRVARWLEPGGRFFMHVFVHRCVPYAFEAHGQDDWMSRHFFSGGMMPSDDLALRFQDRLRLLQRWRWDGRHYEKTANAWLFNLDARREAAHTLLAAAAGKSEAAIRLQRWRIFYMACAELFAYAQGREWWVNHYLFERPRT
jgi:cyclopropane-fatty-acyl-phospholipid synthase